MASTLAVAVTAVLLLGLPLGIVLGRLAASESGRVLQREADNLATAVEFSREAGRPVDPAAIAEQYPDRYIVIESPGRPPVVVGVAPPPGARVARTVREAGFTLTIALDTAAIRARVLRARLLIGAIALLAIGAAVGLAVVQARRLTRPLADLAAVAERLGSGDARPSGRRYGVAELDQVAAGLERSARRVGELLQAERDFATDASHQLRTPLTALSMRLEEMIAAAGEPEVVREEARAALSQTERLTEVVDDLLGRSRGGDKPCRAVVDDIIDQQVAEWEPAFRRAGRELRVTGERGLRARARPGGLGQVLASLLDNALAHGAGAVTVHTVGGPSSVVVEVSDEGAGVPDELARRIFERNVSGHGGTGLGLALARALAVADGGRLVLVQPRPPKFAVFLRRDGERGEHASLSGPA